MGDLEEDARPPASSPSLPPSPASQLSYLDAFQARVDSLLYRFRAAHLFLLLGVLLNWGALHVLLTSFPAPAPFALPLILALPGAPVTGALISHLCRRIRTPPCCAVCEAPELGKPLLGDRPAMSFAVMSTVVCLIYAFVLLWGQVRVVRRGEEAVEAARICAESLTYAKALIASKA